MHPVGLRDMKKARTRAAIAGAALDLFAERGYAGVTMGDVAARAGVAERTVFRYFADKDELLFGEDDQMKIVFGEALAARPPREPAVRALRAAAVAVSTVLADRHADLVARRRVLAETGRLQARERAKQADWERELAEGLAGRGLDEARARVLARVGVACFDEGMGRWLDQPPGAEGGLGVFVDRAFDDLARVVGED